MFRTMVTVAIVLATCFSAVAQDIPKVEIYGGYAGVKFNNPDSTQTHIFNNGWSSAIAFNFDKHFGVVGDFGGYYGTHTGPSFTQLTCFGCPITFPGETIATHLYTYMFGPQFSARMNAFTPFGHALFGGANINQDHAATAFRVPFSVSQSGFAYALGGGFDTNISPRIAWRVEGDYLSTKLVNGFNTREHNARISTGMVFRFGN